MWAKSRGSRRLLVVCLALSAVVGCNLKSSTSSSGHATVGQREVKFTLDGAGGIVALSDRATVSFPGGSVVIEEERAVLGDKEIAKLPKDAKVVEVLWKDGTLTIQADGNQVYESKL